MPTCSHIKAILLSLFIVTICFACTPSSKIVYENFDVKTTEETYKQGLNDAKNMTSAKVSHRLTEVTPENHHITSRNTDTFKVLVVTWKDSADLRFYNNGKPGYFKPGRTNFVTIAPDLINWYRNNHPDSGGLEMRLKELLGLPPGNKKNCFMQFWVKASDLFRPCKDSSITDNYCELDFPAGTDTGYINWWNNYHAGSYSSSTLYNNYPFTGLGYTYDWSPANKTHKGLSEFCIKSDAVVYFNDYSNTWQYFKKHQ